MKRRSGYNTLHVKGKGGASLFSILESHFSIDDDAHRFMSATTEDLCKRVNNTISHMVISDAPFLEEELLKDPPNNCKTKKEDMERSRSKISIQRNWSDLPGDLLGLISLRLSSFDLFSFIWVCSSWQVAAKAINKGRYFPLLVLSDAMRPKDTTRSHFDDVSLFSDKEVSTSTQIETLDCSNPNRTRIGNNICFFDIKDKQECLLKNPLSFCSNYNRIIGSHPDGWLVMLDEFKHPYLLNLIPQLHRIQLPNILLRPNGKLKKNMVWTKAIMSVSNPTIDKDDFLVVVMQYDERKVAFWTQGANEWMGLKGQTYFDVAFFDDTLFALKVVGTSKDVSLDGWNIESFRSGLPEKLFNFKVSCMTRGKHYYHCLAMTMKLMISPVNNEIIILSYGGGYGENPDNWKWTAFGVDLSEGSCVEMNTLNGKALFFDRCSSIFVSSKDVEHHGYKPNSIYYISCWEGDGKMKLRNLGIEDGEMQIIWESRPNAYVGSSWIAPTI